MKMRKGWRLRPRKWCRPNIVLIVADDVGYGDLGCYGRTDYATPNLDALAQQGLRFTQAYAASPMCTPTRCGLMTGRYPARQQVGLREPLLPDDRDLGIEPADHPTLASRLKAAGYATSLVGKWHLGYADPGAARSHGPLQHGFDNFYGVMGYGIDYFSHLGPDGQHDLWDGSVASADSGYATDLFSDRAVAQVQSLPQPFFLCLTYTAPHFPWQAPNDTSAPFFEPSDPYSVTAGTYAAMMQRMDDGVGSVMAALAARGIAQDTLVVFTSDNGGADGLADQGGLRGAKMGLLEGGIRVPAIVRWPRMVPAATATSQVAWTLDWMPTLLEAARASPGAGYPLDGISLLPRIIAPRYWLRPLRWRRRIRSRTLYWRLRNQHAVRHGLWKYLNSNDGAGGVTPGEYLYNLASNPAEAIDLATDPACQTVLQDMRNLYAAWAPGMLAYP